MTSLELILVGGLLMLFVVTLVAVAVLSIVELRKANKNIEANTDMVKAAATAIKGSADTCSNAMRSMIPELKANAEAGEAIKVIALHTPALLAQFEQLAKLLNVFNGAVLKESAKPVASAASFNTVLPPTPSDYGRMFSAVPTDDGSSFTPYDEATAYRAEQIRQAQAAGVRVSDEPEVQPRPEQMVNVGEAVAAVPVQSSEAIPDPIPGAAPVESLEAVPVNNF